MNTSCSSCTSNKTENNGLYNLTDSTDPTIKGIQITGSQLVINYSGGSNPKPPKDGINIPANKKSPREYIFLSYWCAGDKPPAGICSTDQIINAGINWLLFGFLNIDWNKGTINVESILNGDCSKGNLTESDFENIVSNYLVPLHNKGVCISLSCGGQGGNFPSTPPSDSVISEMVSSFKIFRTKYLNVFDGIDLDFEHGGTSCIDYINKIGKAFKDEGFLISCAPTAAQLHPGAQSGGDFQTFATVDLTIFDFVMPQWYQGGCATTGTLTGPYPNTLTSTDNLTKIGFCPKPGNDWGQNTIDYLNIWTKYPSVCSQDDFKDSVSCQGSNSPPKCSWDATAAFGEIKPNLSPERVIFDTPQKLNKLIIGVKTWSGATTQSEPGVATIDNIQNVVKQFKDIGGVGTWAIYHQCGNGDTEKAKNFSTAVAVPPPGMKWYTDIGSFLKNK